MNNSGSSGPESSATEPKGRRPDAFWILKNPNGKEELDKSKTGIVNEISITESIF